MLFNEPKLLKLCRGSVIERAESGIYFSALQRAEIAEIVSCIVTRSADKNFSALQRAEIAEIAVHRRQMLAVRNHFSALQRAEIAEIAQRARSSSTI